MSQSGLSMTVEQTIKNDPTGKAKAGLQAYYGSQSDAISRQIAQGLSPREFEKLNAVKKALQATNHVLNTL